MICYHLLNPAECGKAEYRTPCQQVKAISLKWFNQEGAKENFSDVFLRFFLGTALFSQGLSERLQACLRWSCRPAPKLRRATGMFP